MGKIVRSSRLAGEDSRPRESEGRLPKHGNKAAYAFAVLCALSILFVLAAYGTAQQVTPATSPQVGKMSASALLEGYRHVEAASVSDAIEELTGRKMYMTHNMRPICPAKCAGLARTVMLKKEEGHQGSQALS